MNRDILCRPNSLSSLSFKIEHVFFFFFFVEFAGAKICFLQYQQTFKSLYFVKRNFPQVQVCVFASLKKNLTLWD